MAILRLGNLLGKMGGRDQEAIQQFLKAQKLRPQSPIPHNNIGLALLRMGDEQGALQAFKEGLASTAAGVYGRGMILNNLGHLYNKMSLPDLASQVLEEAMAEDPTAETFVNLASALIELGQYSRAAEIVTKGIESGQWVDDSVMAKRLIVTAMLLDGKVEEAANTMRGIAFEEKREIVDQVSETLLELDRGQEAIALISIALGRFTADDFVDLGSALTKMHESRESLRSWAAALRLDPLHYRGLKEAAFAVYGAARYTEAERFFRRMISISEQDVASLAESYNGLGASIEMTHSRLDEAVECYRRSHQLQKDFIPPFYSLVHLLGRICDWRTWKRDFKKMRQLIRGGAATGIGPIFALAYPLSDEDMCAVAKSRARLVLDIVEPLRPEFTPWAPKWNSRFERLAIGIISADLNARPVGQLFQGVFSKFDRSRFELFGFGLAPNDGSQVLFNIHSACDDFFFVHGLAPLFIAELVNSAQIHILIDLNGYTDGGRLEVAALKPAAVTVNYLGFPYTSALPGIDYVLTDRVATPPELTACFTERAAWLPNTYMVNDHRQSQLHQISGTFTAEDAAAHGVPHHSTTTVFANFNHLQKLGPETFELWSVIMNASHGSKLWLLKFPKEAEQHIKREAVSRGIDPQRFLFTDKFADVDHLRVKRAASLLLDTLEYNAHVSGLDALWAGLPLVTLAGRNMARRCGASFLRTLGVAELLARTGEDYVSIANELASQPQKLSGIRKKIEAQRLKGPLFDTQQWVDELEVMLRLMWEVAAHEGTGQVEAGHGRFHLLLSGFGGWGTHVQTRGKSKLE